MNITPLSNSSTIFSSPLNNNVIKALEKQKMQLQDQIRETKVSKLDAKTKQDTIKQLQDQIQQIDMEIQQKQNEELNKDKENKATDSHSSLNSINDENNLSSINMTDLIQASSSYLNSKLLKKAKNELLNNKQIIKTEIKLDGFTTNYKELNLKNIDSNIRSLNEKFNDSIQTTQIQLTKAAKHGQKEDSNPIGEEENNSRIENLSIPAMNPINQNIGLSPKNEDSNDNHELKEKQFKYYSKVDKYV